MSGVIRPPLLGIPDLQSVSSLLGYEVIQALGQASDPFWLPADNNVYIQRYPDKVHVFITLMPFLQ